MHIPENKHCYGKDITFTIEQSNSDTRHWLARFIRRSKSTTRSIPMLASSIAVGITKDLTERYNAVNFAKAASQILGGKGGGGRPDFAQAGGTDATKIDDALGVIKGLI